MFNGPPGLHDPEVEHGVDGFPEGLVSNPLRQTISFRTWAICLPRWILSSRTTLGWQLFRSFTARSTLDALVVLVVVLDSAK